MNKIKLIFGVGLIILFVGSTFISLFGAGNALQSVLKTYVFQVEECNYKYAPRPIDREEYVEPEETCSIDYNRAKKDVAEGLAMFLVSIPIALLSIGQGRKMWTKEEE